MGPIVFLHISIELGLHCGRGRLNASHPVFSCSVLGSGQKEMLHKNDLPLEELLCQQ